MPKSGPMGTTIMSDCWSSINCLVDKGFRPQSDILGYPGDPTNSIVGAWPVVKRSLKGTCKRTGQLVTCGIYVEETEYR